MQPSDISAADIGVWFPKVRTGTGTDSYTTRLAEALRQRGVRAEITWLPPRGEYFPWSITRPETPSWPNIAHVTTSLHKRFIPDHIPVVSTIHLCLHTPFLAADKTLLRRLYHRFWIRRCESSSLRASAAVTAVSHYNAHQARVVFDRNDVVVIHNWVNLDTFSSDARSKPHTPFRLLFVGNVTRRKGSDLLPKIMRMLGPDFELRFTGTKEELVGRDPLPGNIIALGRIPDGKPLAHTYRDCDALLFPSRLEGFGLVALEAQACGRPVICTDASSLPEVVTDGVGGFLCPMDDISAFAQAACALRDNPERWRSMSIAARQHAAAHFSEERAVARYIRVYKDVIARQITNNPTRFQ